MKVFNSLSGHKEELIPISDHEVNIYVCGPTVYNYFHIGNARPFVVFDTLRRYLEYRGYKVNFVQNFTDVDDKIINRAREEGAAAADISEKYIKAYFADAGALGIAPATVHPKVTDNIDAIIEFVQDLIAKGAAYEVDGDVYFSARSFKGYGKLSGQDIDELESGARVSPDERKRDPLDFALWKARKSEDEIAWESPWGPGRPGWHIECSAMSRKYLGETIDIHAGGRDLMFPHHENEIAQSEARSGKPLAHYWMHNGYITVAGEKMSKSEGNFFTVRDVLKDYSGAEIRFFLLSGHYRGPINFSRDLMDQSRASLSRIRNSAQTLAHLQKNGSDGMTAAEQQSLADLDNYRDRFIAAMDDDLNTADAISVIFELIAAINKAIASGSSREFAGRALDIIYELTGVLGIDLRSLIDDKPGAPDIASLIEARAAARVAKDWARADQIRDQLKSLGVTLKDTPQGVQIIRE